MAAAEAAQGSSWRRAVLRAADAYSARARQRRAELFHDVMSVESTDQILDLGASDCTHIAALGLDGTIYVADIDGAALADSAAKYGYTPVEIPPSGRLPFPDRYFDVVFCSSVIEHVTIPKEELHLVRTTAEFRERAWKAQQDFAAEIRRIGKRYFVQTPYRYFLVESHTWLPGLVAVLPRQVQLRLIDFTNRWWPKRTQADFNLLTVREFEQLFPDASILRERSMGMTKSLIAVK